jgi:hypothetical protein
MNTSAASGPGSSTLVEIIQFKWLMAHEGRHVHVERMQNDPAYAAETLDWAEASSNPNLPDVARALRAALKLAR